MPSEIHNAKVLAHVPSKPRRSGCGGRKKSVSSSTRRFINPKIVRVANSVDFEAPIFKCSGEAREPCITTKPVLRVNLTAHEKGNLTALVGSFNVSDISELSGLRVAQAIGNCCLNLVSLFGAQGQQLCFNDWPHAGRQKGNGCGNQGNTFHLKSSALVQSLVASIGAMLPLSSRGRCHD